MNPAEESFENAFMRLEKIVEKMSSGSLPLEESLKLFEEATKLTQFCSTTLQKAEERIEILLKQKNGDLVMDEEKIAKEPFFKNDHASL